LTALVDTCCSVCVSQVKVWFQNRRTKNRRSTSEAGDECHSRDPESPTGGDESDTSNEADMSSPTPGEFGGLKDEWDDRQGGCFVAGVCNENRDYRGISPAEVVIDNNSCVDAVGNDDTSLESFGQSRSVVTAHYRSHEPGGSNLDQRDNSHEQYFPSRINASSHDVKQTHGALDSVSNSYGSPNSRHASENSNRSTRTTTHRDSTDSIFNTSVPSTLSVFAPSFEVPPTIYRETVGLHKQVPFSQSKRSVNQKHVVADNHKGTAFTEPKNKKRHTSNSSSSPRLRAKTQKYSNSHGESISTV